MSAQPQESADIDVLIVGAGIAGMSAAVAAAEAVSDGAQPRVVVIDRSPEIEAGGNTKWSGATLRLEDVYDVGPNFVSDLLSFTDGEIPPWYADRLAELVPEAMDWIQSHGVRLRRAQTYFINATRSRLEPVGGGEGLLRCLHASAQRLGVEMRYMAAAQELVRSDDGGVAGVVVSGPDGTSTIRARTVVIASGGFQGNQAMMDRELGTENPPLRPIAAGGYANRGEGIEMALALGARRSGDWTSFHAEPIDPRSPDPEAVVMTFPFGILVNERGERFVDEATATADECYEQVARTIWRQPGGQAYVITDERLKECDNWQKGLLTSVKPCVADSIEELAGLIGVPADRLAATVLSFNEAVLPGEYDWRRPDGKSTGGISPAKSNWAMPMESPPFMAYPIVCSIVFTFGGLAVDEQSLVLRTDGSRFPNLYAVGECTGIYRHKYPGGSSVLRGLVFGREVGRHAVRQSLGQPDEPEQIRS